MIHRCWRTCTLHELVVFSASNLAMIWRQMYWAACKYLKRRLFAHTSPKQFYGRICHSISRNWHSSNQRYLPMERPIQLNFTLIWMEGLFPASFYSSCMRQTFPTRPNQHPSLWNGAIGVWMNSLLKGMLKRRHICPCLPCATGNRRWRATLNLGLSNLSFDRRLC